ncbi:MAG: hypothetical protein HYV09_30440 [Deltaproteobacteria bacterium]|nr:hypothetical protein [Deltaproteobacteria bacterium]
MQISADATLPFPRPMVFAAYRDDLTQLLAYLPNVRNIEVKSRKEDGPRVELVNIWHGGGEIPAAARAVLSEAMLSWTDYASWDGTAWACDWRTETHAFTEAVDCKGRNRFIEVDGGTRIEIRGDLKIDAKKVKGVPGFLAGKVASTAEGFLAGKIQPNLIEVTEGLRKYLAEKK